MIIYSGRKLSPNETAKLIIEDKLDIAESFWFEDSSLELDRMTEREKEAVEAAIANQARRVRKFLGIYTIWRKRKMYGDR
jgi:hypothetical protein